MKQFNEALTTSSGEKMTWGFEFECVHLHDKKEEIKNFLNKIQTRYGEFTDEFDSSVKVFDGEKDLILKNEIFPSIRNQLGLDVVQNQNNIIRDNYKGWEFQSPILSVDLATFVSAYSTLSSLLKQKRPVDVQPTPILHQDDDVEDDFFQPREIQLPLAFTNDSCGFHIHLGFNLKQNYTKELLWMYFQMVLSNKEDKEIDLINTKAKLSDFYIYDKFAGDFPFLNPHYASPEMFKGRSLNFKSYGKEQYLNAIKETFDVPFIRSVLDKYNLVRLHSQFGTMEWRGPRGFFEANAQLKDLFINFVYPFMQFMLAIHENTHIKLYGFTLTKKEFFQAIDSNNGASKLMHDTDMGIHVNTKKMTGEEASKFTSSFQRKKLYQLTKSFMNKIKTKDVKYGFHDSSSFYIEEGVFEAKEKMPLPPEIEGCYTKGVLKNFIMPKDLSNLLLHGTLRNCDIELYTNKINAGLYNCNLNVYHFYKGENIVAEPVINDCIIDLLKMGSLNPDITNFENNVIKKMALMCPKHSIHKVTQEHLNTWDGIFELNKIMKVIVQDDGKNFTLPFIKENNETLYNWMVEKNKPKPKTPRTRKKKDV